MKSVKRGYICQSRDISQKGRYMSKERKEGGGLAFRFFPFRIGDGKPGYAPAGVECGQGRMSGMQPCRTQIYVQTEPPRILHISEETAVKETVMTLKIADIFDGFEARITAQGGGGGKFPEKVGKVPEAPFLRKRGAYAGAKMFNRSGCKSLYIRNFGIEAAAAECFGYGAGDYLLFLNIFLVPFSGCSAGARSGQ